MKKDYLALSDGDFDTWEENFNNQIGALAAAVGVDPAQVAAITTEIATHRSLYSAADAAKNAAQAAVGTARARRKTTTGMVRPLVRQIKAHPGYTENIGETLDIIGPDEGIDWDDEIPTLAVKLVGGNIVIEFNKKKSDGVKIYSKQGNQTEFTFLALDTESPYVDNRPKLAASGANPAPPNPGSPSPTPAAQGPENREYYAYYVVSDEQVGLLSATVKITLP